MSTSADFTPHQVKREDRDDGSIVLSSGVPLGPVAPTTADWLHHWAEQTPDRIFLAERNDEGGWDEVSYRQALDTVRAYAAGLLAMGLSRDKPLIILSSNSIAHGLLALAGQYVGVPVVPLAEQYSLIEAAQGRLRYIVGKVLPGMVYAEDGEQYANALGLDIFETAALLVRTGSVPGRKALSLDELVSRGDGIDIDAAHERVGPDTVVKLLFTSGSTSEPKGVETTHRMMCVNQAQIAAGWPFLKKSPPVITDWLPWNHVFGGSHNFNMALANGGTLNIDAGKPAPGVIGTTLQNLKERPPTIAFNVPAGFGMLLDAMETDEELRQAYFRDLKVVFYAGASLPQPMWEKLRAHALDVSGQEPLMASSWGMTETAPAHLLVHQKVDRSGLIGVPLPEAEVRLIPDEDGRCELRVKGPNVLTGYYKDDKRTAEAFDEEGWFVTGDAVLFAEPGNDEAGLVFDGRVGEDFKLLTGTWVRASTLRLDALKALSGLAADCVVCGRDRGEIGLLVFPHPQALASHGDEPDGDGLNRAAALKAALAERLAELARGASGSSKRIARAAVMAEPPSVADNEITAKGSLNVAKIQKRRAALIDRLYTDADPAVIRISRS